MMASYEAQLKAKEKMVRHLLQRTKPSIWTPNSCQSGARRKSLGTAIALSLKPTVGALVLSPAELVI